MIDCAKRKQLYDFGFREVEFDIKDASGWPRRADDTRHFTWLRITPTGIMPYSQEYLEAHDIEHIVSRFVAKPCPRSEKSEI